MFRDRGLPLRAFTWDISLLTPWWCGSSGGLTAAAGGPLCRWTRTHRGFVQPWQDVLRVGPQAHLYSWELAFHLRVVPGIWSSLFSFPRVSGVVTHTPCELAHLWTPHSFCACLRGLEEHKSLVWCWRTFWVQALISETVILINFITWSRIHSKDNGIITFFSDYRTFFLIKKISENHVSVKKKQINNLPPINVFVNFCPGSFLWIYG